ncbi:hypothetical protein SAMN05444008_1072 [Cnuella takakiae]|uniref:DUF4476 domain-containing protein n=2 Tax=Cnuella takakiae TaxID=1302690 RepID=A0A1M5ATF8_9BACT|nr:hypothetical protein BUE76_16010 [Cnuella takakiae]SHF33510.1 hypothetical protein SAMN05444008_1072 [Cnuella takakiae]
MLAQKVYFVYIQSESRNPFYAKMGDKVFSSTAAGYLILSKLKDSTYAFQVGPAANEGEQRFEISLSGKDRGFLLKKFTDGWGLYDLQTLAIIKPAGRATSLGNGTRVREDRFTTLLSQAADDTSLLYQPAVSIASSVKKKKEEKPTVSKNLNPEPAEVKPAETVAAGLEAKTDAPKPTPVDSITEKPVAESAKQPDTVALATAPEPKPVAADTRKAEPIYKRSQITRRSESSTVEGFGLVYLDDADGVVDTIRLVIPNPRQVFADAAPAEEKETTAVVKPAAPAVACNGQAGEKDFFKLRRNLASIDSEAGMTQAAVEAFRKRCFSVDQIKNLSSLFLTQSGKYAFLEASYPYVSNREQFATLQSELFDATYLARFKALTSN